MRRFSSPLALAAIVVVAFSFLPGRANADPIVPTRVGYYVSPYYYARPVYVATAPRATYYGPAPVYYSPVGYPSPAWGYTYYSPYYAVPPIRTYYRYDYLGYPLNQSRLAIWYGW